LRPRAQAGAKASRRQEARCASFAGPHLRRGLWGADQGPTIRGSLKSSAATTQTAYFSDTMASASEDWTEDGSTRLR
jgi:hypothetical protein